MDFDWINNTQKELEVGDRIKLFNMVDDYAVPKGEEGVVTKIHPPYIGVVEVKWDNKKYTLNLAYEKIPGDVDTFEILDSKINEDTIEGGLADELTPEEIADKHGVSVEDIQNEIETGIEIELEHTNDPLLAKEITLDHIVEFPDYYTNKKYGLVSSEKGLEKVHEAFFGSIGNAFGKKQNKDDQYDTDKMVSHLKKIVDTIKTSDIKSEETIVKMIENFREKYKEHSKIDTMIKSLYQELRDKGQGIDELTSAGSSGSFSGPLFGGPVKNKFYNETKVIKVKDLLDEATTTKNSGKITDSQSQSPFDANKDGWFWNDESWYEGGEIVDDIAQLDTNWKDELISITKEDLVKSVKLVEGHENITTKTCEECQGSGIKMGYDPETGEVTDEGPCWYCGGEGHTIIDKEDEGLEETTTFGSVFGGDFPVTPTFAAKKGKHIPSKKPIWAGGKIVQKIKNSGVLSEINKKKYHKDADYVKFDPKCVKYNNKPWCSQGAVDKPIKLSKTTSDNISEVAKKLGMTEEEVKKVIINKLSK